VFFPTKQKENIMSGIVTTAINPDTSIQTLLLRNPSVADVHLKGAIKCNLVNDANVSVQTKIYQFAVGKKEARVIYITPYKWTDGIRSLKRFLVGVKFQGNLGDENRITNYVLGKLAYKDPNYEIAKRETDRALEEGRRLIIAVTEDDIKIEFEKDQGGCSVM
jgi:hypothetical protein